MKKLMILSLGLTFLVAGMVACGGGDDKKDPNPQPEPQPEQPAPKTADKAKNPTPTPTPTPTPPSTAVKKDTTTPTPTSAPTKGQAGKANSADIQAALGDFEQGVKEICSAKSPVGAQKAMMAMGQRMQKYKGLGRPEGADRAKFEALAKKMQDCMKTLRPVPPKAGAAPKAAPAPAKAVRVAPVKAAPTAPPTTKVPAK
jgi:hypothetical protein